MSVEFTLHDNSLSLRQWRGLLYAWQQRFGRDLYDAATFSSTEPAIALVWGPESTRGFVLACAADGRVTARFNDLASRADWVRGFHIMRIAVRQAAGWWERSTGELYGIDPLVPEQANEEAAREFAASARAHSGTVLLPFRDFDVPVSRAELSGRVSAVEHALALRIRRYATAVRAATMALPDGTRTATWSLAPTIVDSVDLVLVDWRDGLSIPLARLKAALGTAAEALGPGKTFLPELDPTRDASLLEALAAGGDEEPLEGEIVEAAAAGPARPKPPRRRRRW